MDDMTLSMMAVMAFGMVFIGVQGLKVQDRLGALERKVDRLLCHLGVEGEREMLGDEVFWALVNEGETTKAIKRYREVTGAGLKEAKDYVDSLKRCG